MTKRKSLAVYVSIFALVAVAGLTLSSCTETEEQSKECATEEFDGYAVYNDESDLYSLQYPEDWEVETDSSAMVEVQIASPLESEDDTFAENFNVISEEESSDGLTGDFLELSMDQLIEELENTYDGFELISREEMTLSGLDAEKIRYKATYMDIPVEAIQVITYDMEEEMTYIVTFSTEQDKTDYDETFDNIIESFCIK